MDWVKIFSPNNDVYIEFLSYFNNNSFSQLVEFPTRGNNLLDVILSDNSSQFRNIHSLPPISNSDHVTIVCDMSIDIDTADSLAADPHTIDLPDNESYKFSTYKYEGADWLNISAALSTVDWRNIFDVCTTVDDCWLCFCEILQDVFNFYIPKKPVRKPKHFRNGRNKRTIKRKYPNKIHRAMTKKLKAWRLYKADRSSDRKSTFAKRAANLKKEIFNYDLTSEQKLIEGGSSKEFYSYVKSKTTCRDSIPPLTKANGTSYTQSDAEKATVLNDYFCSIFTKNNNILQIFQFLKLKMMSFHYRAYIFRSTQ